MESIAKMEVTCKYREGKETAGGRVMDEWVTEGWKGCLPCCLAAGGRGGELGGRKERLRGEGGREGGRRGEEQVRAPAAAVDWI